jgi:hypothetical protein
LTTDPLFLVIHNVHYILYNDIIIIVIIIIIIVENIMFTILSQV